MTDAAVSTTAYSHLEFDDFPKCYNFFVDEKIKAVSSILTNYVPMTQTLGIQQTSNFNLITPLQLIFIRFIKQNQM